MLEQEIAQFQHAMKPYWLTPAREKMNAIGLLSENQVRSTPLKNGGDHSFGSRFGPLRNRRPVLRCRLLDSGRRDGENSEKTRKNGAKMGEIWPKKKSAGRRPICDG